MVNRRYNLVYIQENPNMGFSLVSDIPFQIPVVGQWFEGSHNDVKLSGKVTKLAAWSPSSRPPHCLLAIASKRSTEKPRITLLPITIRGTPLPPSSLKRLLPSGDFSTSTSV